MRIMYRPQWDMPSPPRATSQYGPCRACENEPYQTSMGIWTQTHKAYQMGTSEVCFGTLSTKARERSQSEPPWHVTQWNTAQYGMVHFQKTHTQVFMEEQLCKYLETQRFTVFSHDGKFLNSNRDCKFYLFITDCSVYTQGERQLCYLLQAKSVDSRCCQSNMDIQPALMNAHSWLVEVHVGSGKLRLPNNRLEFWHVHTWNEHQDLRILTLENSSGLEYEFHNWN